MSGYILDTNVISELTKKSGRVLDLGDALIAGTAKTRDLCVATRNIGDFAGLDVKVTNPWKT